MAGAQEQSPGEEEQVSICPESLSICRFGRCADLPTSLPLAHRHSGGPSKKEVRCLVLKDLHDLQDQDVQVDP